MGKNDTMLVGEYLKDLIKQAGTTQKEIAKILGVHENTVCNWCKGKYKIKSKYVGKLIDYFNKNIYVTNFNPAVLMGVDIPTAFIDNETLNNLKQKNQELRAKISRLEEKLEGSLSEEELEEWEDSLFDMQDKLKKREKKLKKKERTYKKRVQSIVVKFNKNSYEKNFNLSVDIENALRAPKFLKKYGEIFNITEDNFKNFKNDIVQGVKKNIIKAIATKLKELYDEEIARAEEEIDRMYQKAEETEE